MVNDYVLPAMHGTADAASAASADQALRKELELSAKSQGVPGTALAFNDGPEKK